LAFLALDQKQYEQALKEIEGASGVFNDPDQQTEALYCVAEARAALAKEDPAALKDAALAYMRVVARAKTARVGSARVPDALLKTAAIQERLGAAKEALLLYQQVADEFKGTDAANRAAEAADRLGKSARS
jgi:TolA-binding protein